MHTIRAAYTNGSPLFSPFLCILHSLKFQTKGSNVIPLASLPRYTCSTEHLTVPHICGFSKFSKEMLNSGLLCFFTFKGRLLWDTGIVAKSLEKKERKPCPGYLGNTLPGLHYALWRTQQKAMETLQSVDTDFVSR